MGEVMNWSPPEERSVPQEEAEKIVDTAIGDYIKLDPKLRSEIIKDFGKARKKGERLTKKIEDAKKCVDRAREGGCMDLLKTFPHILPSSEKDLIQKPRVELSLPRENCEEMLDDLKGVALKLEAYDKIHKARGTGYLGESPLDKPAALVKGMSPLDAGKFLTAYYDLRVLLAESQDANLLTQEEVNTYIGDVDEKPEKMAKYCIIVRSIVLRKKRNKGNEEQKKRYERAAQELANNLENVEPKNPQDS